MIAPGRILVTGAYGFIGAAYCAHLAATGRPYIGVVRERHPAESRPEIVAIGDFVQTDWVSMFGGAPIERVVHLAARAHRMRDTAADPRAEYRKHNVRVTDRLLAAARLARVKRFVFTSTVKVHGESTPPGHFLRETDPIQPADEYAHSKAAAEAHVREFGRELELPVSILRLPLVYGPGVKANFGQLVDAVRRRRVLPVAGIHNRRSLLGLTNCCSAIDTVLEHPLAVGETYLVTDGDTVSTPELVRAIASALDVRPRLWRVPQFVFTAAAAISGGRRSVAGRIMHSFAIDDAKIRRSLGWTPPFTMADELQRLK